MAASDDRATERARLKTAGLVESDLRWLDGLGWSADKIPPIADQAQHDDYARRVAAIERSIDHLSFAERSVSSEGQIAAMLGARMADWRERDDEDDA